MGIQEQNQAAEEKYENGDSVYYKREGKENKWLGQGRLFFRTVNLYFVRHGGVRVSPNILKLK